MLATLFAAPAFAQAPSAASNPAINGTQMAWGLMTRYFTAAAEQMPESDYGYKPVPTVRSFGEMVGHVAGAQYMFCAAVLGEPQKSEDDIEKSAKTKAALVAALKASNEYCARAYQLSGNDQAARSHLTRFDQLTQSGLGKPISLAYGEQGTYSTAEPVAGVNLAPDAFSVKFIPVAGQAGIRA